MAPSGFTNYREMLSYIDSNVASMKIHQDGGLV